jgi:hypothetical protein
MSYEIVTGLSATRGSTGGNADMTFIWDVIENGNKLDIICKFGGGDNISNSASATIHLGSLESVDLTQNQNNPDIQAEGKVSAKWSSDNKSYVITFSGVLVRPNVNNVYSSNLNNNGSINHEIIVAAYLN